VYQVSVCYNQPESPEAFVDHYTAVHAGLVREMPGLVSFEWTVCESLDGSVPPHFVTARMTWPSKDEALAAFGSPEGKAATGDLPNFAMAGASITAGEVRG
jgi:uncharacterized protein (TIGR02118 family)